MTAEEAREAADQTRSHAAVPSRRSDVDRVSSGSAYFAARSISINTTPDLELLTPDRCGATTQPVDWAAAAQLERLGAIFSILREPPPARAGAPAQCGSIPSAARSPSARVGRSLARAAFILVGLGTYLLRGTVLGSTQPSLRVGMRKDDDRGRPPVGFD